MLKKIQNQSDFIQCAIGILFSFLCLAVALCGFLLFRFFFPGIGDSLIVHFLFIASLLFLYSAVIIYIIKFLSKRIRNQAHLLEENEQKLLNAEKEKMRANLLRAISHDLRTPLTGIIGNSMAYLENQDILTVDEKEAIVRNIYEDSNWLINMVENILTITRIKDQDLNITTCEESVEEVIGEAVQRMQKRHPSCNIRVSAPNDFLLLQMDAVLIEQVTINLLENAFMHSGSTEPIDLILENHTDYVSFTVKDYGDGIPQDMLEHLFDGKDYSATSSDVQKGMGIGLVICKTIISAHHGFISGCNHEHGAKFTFTLPKRKENEG